MQLNSRWLTAGALALLLVPAFAADKEKAEKAEKPEDDAPKVEKKAEAPERKKGVFQADRAGWLIGMYIGEDRATQYPVVFQVSPKSEAKDVGIRAGDELIKLNDEPTFPLKNLFNRVNEIRAGRKLNIWVRRGSQTLQFNMSMPQNPGATPEEEEAASQSKRSSKSEDKDGEKKSKKKKRAPVVIKPIPADN